jgi:hypothetical protein
MRSHTQQPKTTPDSLRLFRLIAKPTANWISRMICAGAFAKQSITMISNLRIGAISSQSLHSKLSQNYSLKMTSAELCHNNRVNRIPNI